MLSEDIRSDLRFRFEQRGVRRGSEYVATLHGQRPLGQVSAHSLPCMMLKNSRWFLHYTRRVGYTVLQTHSSLQIYASKLHLHFCCSAISTVASCDYASRRHSSLSCFQYAAQRLKSGAAARSTSQTHTVPAPDEVSVSRPGDDRKLASWNQIVSYFESLTTSSDRVQFQTLGHITMGARFVMATISAPENLSQA